MTGMRCGQGCGTCGAQSKTDARLRLLGLGTVVEIVWAWFNSLVMCFDYSTAQGTVNGGASVKFSQILHLTPSRGGRRVVGIAKKNLFQSGRSACFFEPMVVKLVGQ